MIDVSIDNDRAVFDVLGMHQLWALRSLLEISLAHERTIVVSLAHERHKKLIIEVEDPSAVVDMLQCAIRSRPIDPTAV